MIHNTVYYIDSDNLIGIHDGTLCTNLYQVSIFPWTR